MSTKRVKTSYIWNFFTEKDNSDIIATCNICKQELCYKSSSNNLKKHLERKHPLVQLKDSDSAGTIGQSRSRSRSPHHRSSSASTSTVTEKLEPSTNYSNNSSDEHASPVVHTKAQTRANSFLNRKLELTTKQKIDENLMLLFIKDLQPFSIVEDYGFKNFVNALNPDYQLPSKKFISNSMLQAAYEEAYKDTKEQLEEAKAITLTTDCWTSRNTENFLAITAHFITKDFQLKNVLLDCRSFGELHTSKNLAYELRMVVREWNIENKILIIISDNTAHICKAIKEDLQLKHFGCYAHTINLIVNDSLKQITKILVKVKVIISHFKRSSFAAAKLLEQQKSLKGEANPKKLIQDIDTRWNSTYYMVERFIYLEEPIRTTIDLLPINKDLPIISPEEWQFLNEIVRILKPMETLTNFISGQNYLTASSVIVLTDGLIHTYENLTHQRFMPDAKQLIRSIIIAINNRLGNLECNNILTLATFLDPRYKEFGFSNNQIFEIVKSNVISQITDLIIKKTNDSNELKKQQQKYTKSTSEDMSIWEQFEQRINKFQPSETAQSKAAIEVKRYLGEPPIPRSENPFNWWKVNAYNFPNLAIIVQNNLMTIATSVPCEKLFLKSGQILTERRNRLGSSKVKKMLFLNSYKDNAATGLCNNAI